MKISDSKYIGITSDGTKTLKKSMKKAATKQNSVKENSSSITNLILDTDFLISVIIFQRKGVGSSTENHFANQAENQIKISKFRNCHESRKSVR